jgi:molecular chaperone HscC
LINEPTAAAIAYGLPKLNRDMTFIVLDLGGGTFDVTVLELFESTIEVHASAGDTRNYPGDNFTNHALSMPTKKKQSVPEAITHSMARGICGLAIFLDDADRRYFLDQ